MFCISTFFWLITCLAQFLWKFLIQYRYFADQCEQFVDLLSLANVSLFVFDARYHGFYLHGRSLHQQADSSMLELVEQIKKEEEGMVTKRGLDSSSEVQVFEVYPTEGMRKECDKFRTLVDVCVRFVDADVEDGCTWYGEDGPLSCAAGWA